MPEPGAKLRCTDPGSLRAFVVEFKNHLAALSHTDLTVRGYEDAARHFAEWLERANIALLMLMTTPSRVLPGIDVNALAIAGVAAFQRSMSVACAGLSTSWLSVAL
jgi:hypothetical protein